MSLRIGILAAQGDFAAHARVLRSLGATPVEVRDADGLALSSRNVRLSRAERERALALPRALATKDPAQARRLLRDVDVDYVEVADFGPRVLAAAVRVGDTRLIDNVELVLGTDPV